VGKKKLAKEVIDCQNQRSFADVRTKILVNEDGKEEK